MSENQRNRYTKEFKLKIVCIEKMNTVDLALIDDSQIDWCAISLLFANNSTGSKISFRGRPEKAAAAL
jgi:hypothetical protein